VWDTETGKCLCTKIDDDNPPVALATFSPNGKVVLTASLDSHVKIWDYERQKHVRTYTGAFRLNLFLSAWNHMNIRRQRRKRGGVSNHALSFMCSWRRCTARGGVSSQQAMDQRVDRRGISLGVNPQSHFTKPEATNTKRQRQMQVSQPVYHIIVPPEDFWLSVKVDTLNAQGTSTIPTACLPAS